jgi:ABC-2 type transport system permease protein
MQLLRKAWAFVYRDFLAEASYKFAFVMQLTGIVMSGLTLFFLSKILGRSVSPYLEPYGGDYFSFVLIGIAFASYLHVALSSFSGCVREAQVVGTLEALLVTQTGIPVLVLFSSIYNFVLTSVRVIVYLVLGSFFLGMSLRDANYCGAVLVLLLTIIAFSSLGIISASFVMVLKRGDPFNWVFSNLSWLLGGVLYPVAVLPAWAQKVSYLLPITYSLEAMRLSLLKGRSTAELLPSLLPLMIFAVLTLPLSICLFAYAVRRAKRKGSLTQY